MNRGTGHRAALSVGVAAHSIATAAAFSICLYGGSVTWLVVGVLAGTMLVTCAVLAWAFSTGPLWVFNVRSATLLGTGYYFFLEATLGSDQLGAFSPSRVLEALVLAGAFLMTMFVGCILPRQNFIVKSVAALDQKRGSSLFWPIIVFYLLSLFPYLHYENWSLSQVVYGILAGRSSEAGWMRGNFGDERAFVLALRYFGGAGLLLSVVALLDMRWISVKRWLLAGVIATEVTILFFTGGRSGLGTLVMAVVGYWFVTRNGSWKYGRRIAVTGAVVAFVFVGQIMVQNRSFGFYDALAQSWRIDVGISGIHVDGSFGEFVELLGYFPAEHQFTWGTGLLAIIVQPVPRFVWPEKPVGSVVGFSGWKTGSLEDGGVSATVLADFYSDFGAFGVVIGGLIFGGIVGSWSVVERLVRAKPARVASVVYMFGIFIAFHGVRGLPEIVSYSMTLPALAIILGASRLLQALRSDRTSHMGTYTSVNPSPRWTSRAQVRRRMGLPCPPR